MANPEDEGPGGITRINVGSGIEVLSGELADEALKKVGARAMTLDKKIYVREDFDRNNAEDLALIAHEQFGHASESGGEDSHAGGHDAEEKRAQEIERMTLHRLQRGDDFEDVVRDIKADRLHNEQPGQDSAANPTNEDDPMDAYKAMRAQGMEHDSIVRLLTRHVLTSLAEGEEERQVRNPTSVPLF